MTPSNADTYERKMKSVHDNLIRSKRLLHFLALTFLVNIILTYGLIFHPPPPSDEVCAQYIRAQYPDLILPLLTTPPRSTPFSLLVADTTALAVRPSGELFLTSDRGHMLTGRQVILQKEVVFRTSTADLTSPRYTSGHSCKVWHGGT